jgi:ABC-type transport system involved in cytochrome c biogenesis permease subunit
MEYTLLLILLGIYALSFIFGLFKSQGISSSLRALGLLLHLLILIVRAISANHPPFTNMYESILLLSFLLQVKFIFFQRSASALLVHLEKCIVLAFIVLVSLLSPETRAIRPVMPALNSVWMYIHVPAYLFAYVALFSATILALIHIFSRKSIFAYDKQMDMDVSLSFVFMSIGMLTGAIWGQLSWGNFWSWDPKETWALINLLVMSFYFYKNDRKSQSWIIVFTAISVLFTYFGVTWLLSGLHSYQ